MLGTMQVLALILVAIAMALSLAHALEFPGKKRLGKDTYIAVQAIYYPGFTVGGISEPLGILAVLLLLLLIPLATSVFWLTLAAFVALVLMHATYWMMTHPVNKFWLAGENLAGFSAGFFSFGAGASHEMPEWTALRDRWEYSHVLRAVFAAIAFILLAIGIVLQ
jgi:hypothetical protein